MLTQEHTGTLVKGRFHNGVPGFWMTRAHDTPHGIAVLPQAQQLLPIQVLQVLGKTHAAILWSYHTIAQLKGP